MKGRKFLASGIVGLALLGATALAGARFGENAGPGADASAAMPDRPGTRIRYSTGHYPVFALPGGNERTVRSILNIREPMKYGDFVWDDEGIPDGPLWVRADLDRQLISVFRGGHEIGTAVILYGADSKPTPAGAFPVLEKAADYHSRTYDAPMPFMLRLTADGVAIHGSEVRERAATHGCIGVPLEFARRLFGQMEVGDEVFVLKTA